MKSNRIINELFLLGEFVFQAEKKGTLFDPQDLIWIMPA